LAQNAAFRWICCEDVSTPRSLRLPAGVHPASIRTPRGRFAVLVAQPGRGVCERRPALLVPGFTGSKEDFLAVLEPLALAGRSILAADLRGQFETPGADSPDGYAAAELAADVIALALVIGEQAAGVHLLGHSFGGLIARQAVLAEPGAFTSLTLLGSGPGTIGGQRAAELRRLLEVIDAPASRRQDAAVRAQSVLQLWDSEVLPRARAEGIAEPVAEFLRRRAAGTDPVGLVQMARQLLDFPDRTGDLAAQSRIPVLVSYGENDDAWPPAVQDGMARRLGAQRVCIPGAAHSPAVEAPETTAAMLTAFWNQAENRNRSAAWPDAGSSPGLAPA
jgi:pimeloyl-ACP methyl ester carboxylesterase